MSKKNILILSIAAIAVGGVYFYLFKDYFRRPVIQISHTIRPSMAALFHKGKSAVTVDEGSDDVIFGLNGDYKLTSIKIVSETELLTNKFAHPLWEMVSDSNSVPIRVFAYGMHIRGMHPTVKGAVATALTNNTPYHLFVEAGRLKGEHTFTIPEAAAPPQ